MQISSGVITIQVGIVKNFLTLALLERTAFGYSLCLEIPHTYETKCPYGSEMSSWATPFPAIWTTKSGSFVGPENKKTKICLV